MANTRELRRRIRSVKNTSQITKAMEMVAATKMRRAQAQALSGRPYNQTLKFALNQLLGRVDVNINELLKPKTGGKTALVLISTDKSLCGALNTNLFRSVLTFISEGKNLFMKDQRDLQFYTIGKKGRNLVVKIGADLAADFDNTETVTFRQAAQIARILTKSFLAGEVAEVYLAFPNFVSTLRQEPSIHKLLPLDPEALAKELETSDLSDSHSGGRRPIESQTKDPIASARTSFIASLQDDKVGEDFLFEPDINELLEYILNHAIETKVYQALLETKASEHSARMIAMQNATNNAKELVSDLQLSYNQIRQEGITRELLEITSAMAALE